MIKGIGKWSHDGIKENSPASRFLEEVTSQIDYKPLRASISRELEAHIQDRMEEYEAQGISHEEAQRLAVQAMGSVVKLGEELNQVHQIRKNPVLTVWALLLLLIGFAVSAWMRWSREQFTNGYWYYLPGLLILGVTAAVGYPLVIRFQKKLVWIFGSLYGIWFLFAEAIRYEKWHELVDQMFCNSNRIFSLTGSTHVITYSALLLFGPVLILFFHQWRERGKGAVLAVMTLCGGVIFWCNRRVLYDFGLSASAILLFCVTGTLMFMIRRDWIRGKKRNMYGIVLASFLIVSGGLFLSPNNQPWMMRFFNPGRHVISTWDDTYNAVLIQELLGKTPLAGGLELTEEELMEYGTGAWYFEDSNQWRTYGIFDPYINREDLEITLWDILPQHYHNNYIIAVCILLYGWLPGMVLMAGIGGFYLVMFFCIRRIHGRLASSMAYCCWLCMLFQGIFYVLGNFGYQYGSFSNLPMISEGKISILVNMIMLGFVFSAYQYDHVAEDFEGAKCGEIGVSQGHTVF